MTMNKAWHRAHPMPARATRAQRLAWHEAHAKACGCRPIPAGLQRQLGAAAPARRRLRYGVAISLDGFIAGTKGEFDWIVMDPAIDFGAMYREFDTAVMGRKTHEVMKAMGGGHGALPGIDDTVVFSRTLRPATYPRVRITREDPRRVVQELKARPGKDIWLVRRRQAVSLPSRRGPGGYRGGGRHPGDSRRRDSAAPTRRQDEAGARRFQAAAEDRHRVSCRTPFPAASGPRRASGSSAGAPARRRRPQRSAECSRSRRSSPGGGRSTNTGGCSR